MVPVGAVKTASWRAASWVGWSGFYIEVALSDGERVDM
jgi:hypothetical protein